MKHQYLRFWVLIYKTLLPLINASPNLFFSCPLTYSSVCSNAIFMYPSRQASTPVKVKVIFIYICFILVYIIVVQGRSLQKRVKITLILRAGNGLFLIPLLHQFIYTKDIHYLCNPHHCLASLPQV